MLMALACYCIVYKSSSHLTIDKIVYYILYQLHAFENEILLRIQNQGLDVSRSISSCVIPKVPPHPHELHLHI